MQCLYTRYPVATGGLYPPPGLWPFHILHFPFSPLIGCMRESWHFFFPLLLCTTCDVLETLKQREFGWTCFIDGCDLKQRRSLLCLQWKDGGFWAFFPPDLLGSLESFIVSDCWLDLSLEDCMYLFSYIWLLYDVQLTFLLANYWLWKALQKCSICFFYFTLTLILHVHLECCANDFIIQKSLCFFLLAADSSIVGESRFHS